MVHFVEEGRVLVAANFLNPTSHPRVMQAGEPASTVHFVEEGRVLVAAKFMNPTSHPRVMQAGEPAKTVHFVEEGRVLVAANFLNLPEAQRAVDFPETLLTDSLEWCARPQLRPMCVHMRHRAVPTPPSRTAVLGKKECARSV